MDIAILLSTYNGERFLSKQLDSLVDQSMKDDIHLYIRDDGSSDSTLDIVDSYKHKIDLTIFRGKNIGPAKSFWKLFMDTKIQADYYAFCDQDDIWDLDKIEKGINALYGMDQPGLWCSNCRMIDENDKIVLDKMYEKRPLFTICAQLVCGTTQGCAMIFNDLLRDYVFKKNIKEFPMHDLVLMTYALASGRMIYDQEPSFGYRIHMDNVVAKGGKDRIHKIKTSLYNWFSKKHGDRLSRFAKKLLEDNKGSLDKDTVDYINVLVDSRSDIVSRFRIIFDPKSVSDDKSAERSFKIRVLLGII